MAYQYVPGAVYSSVSKETVLSSTTCFVESASCLVSLTVASPDVAIPIRLLACFNAVGLLRSFTTSPMLSIFLNPNLKLPAAMPSAIFVTGMFTDVFKFSVFVTVAASSPD